MLVQFYDPALGHNELIVISTMHDVMYTKLCQRYSIDQSLTALLWFHIDVMAPAITGNLTVLLNSL